MSGPSGWTWEDKREWFQEQAAKHPDRVDEDISGDEYAIDGGSRFKLLPGEDAMDGAPEWDLLELAEGGDPNNPDAWGLTETFHDVDEALRDIDSRRAPAPQAAPAAPQAPDPSQQIERIRTEMYDERQKGPGANPERMRQLENELQSLTGRRLAQSIWELVMPKLMHEREKVSDREASLLFEMWQSSPKGAKFFQLPKGADSRTAMTLKTRGLVAGYGDQMELTDKGRKVLIEMCTNERNRFEKISKAVSYEEITKNAKKRPRQTHVKKASSNWVAMNCKFAQSGNGGPMNYDVAMAAKAELERNVDEASKALKAFPREPNGLTPDAVKQTPEWQEAKRAYSRAFEAMRNFNATFLRAFPKGRRPQ